MRCDKCLYWRLQTGLNKYDDDVDDREGVCYRNPPLPNPVSVGCLIAARDEDGAFEEMRSVFNWVRPATTGGDFCGKFVAK